MSDESEALESDDNPGFLNDSGFSHRACLEFNVNEGGIAIVGNVEGYLALARVCTLMAELHADLREDKNRKPDRDTVTEWGEYHLHEYITAKAINERRFIFSPGPVQEKATDACVPDVLFYLADQIGPAFWGPEVPSGPTQDWLERTIPFAVQELEEDAEEDE